MKRRVILWNKNKKKRSKVFCYWSAGMGSQTLTPIYLKKVKNFKAILNDLSSNTMSNGVDKYIKNTFSIVNTPYPCHWYVFITENSSPKFAIMSFWTPAPKSPSENGNNWNFQLAIMFMTLYEILKCLDPYETQKNKYVENKNLFCFEKRNIICYTLGALIYQKWFSSGGNLETNIIFMFLLCYYRSFLVSCKLPK